jgi:nucleoside-diphosphate-sugar epimerase
VKVLVTGASGFLGSYVVEQLIEGQHEVRALVRATSDTRALEKLGVELCEASLETGAGLGEAVRGVDGVVHSAAIVRARSADEFHRINAGGTRTLIEAVVAGAPNLQRFVYVSSLAAHGFGINGEPRQSAHPSEPVTHYGRSKLAGEQIVLEHADRIPVTVIRPPAIYGPRDREMLAFFRIVSSGVVPFLGNPDSRCSLIYAPDCARAIVLALTTDHPSKRIYSVEDGQVYTQRDVVGHIETALGKKAYAKFAVPMVAVSVAAFGSELYGRARNMAMMLTRDKVNELRAQQVIERAEAIRADLGWEPSTEFGEGAQHSVTWYRSQGLL